MDWNESELENDDLKNYKAKAEFYVRQHMDNAAIAKLKSNVPLTAGMCRYWKRFSGAKSVPKRIMRPSTDRNLWENLCGKSSDWI